jgi:acyl-CoA thioesterase-1
MPDEPMRAARTVLLALVVVVTATCGGAAPPAAGRGVPARLVAAGGPASVPVAGSRTGTQGLEAQVRGAPIRLQFVGASVTEGWFASSGGAAYTALVAGRLATSGRGVRSRVLARPGITAREADDWDLRISTDVVIVQLATNDFVQGVPVPVFAAYYGDVLGRLRTASPRADLICLGGWDDPGDRNRLGVAAVDYDVATRTACGAEGGRYVDLSAIYLDARNHGPEGRPTFHGAGDVFHPNDRGHEAVATAVLAGDGLLGDTGSAP